MIFQQCIAGHWNRIPTPPASLGYYVCGDRNCRGPLAGPAYEIAPGPALAAQHCTSGPFYYRCANGHWSVTDERLRGTDAERLAVCGHPGCAAGLASHASTDRPTAPLYALVSAIADLRDLHDPVTDKHKTGGEVDLYDQQVFKYLFSFARQKFTADGSVEFLVGETRYAVLRSPSREFPLHPYCYPSLRADGGDCHADARYEDIGRQLMQYTPDFIDSLLTVAIRVMKQKHTRDDIDCIANICNNVDLILSPRRNALPVRWHPLSLLCVLVGSAAAETGRGLVGFVNVLAAFHHIKHDARKAWNNWAHVIGQPGADFDRNTNRFLDQTKQGIEDVYPSSYSFNGSEPKRNSVGFSGSERMIKAASGEVPGTSIPPENESKWRAYKEFVKRDINHFAKWQGPDYRILGPGSPPSADTAENFERKVLRHLQLLFGGRGH